MRVRAARPAYAVVTLEPDPLCIVLAAPFLESAANCWRSFKLSQRLFRRHVWSAFSAPSCGPLPKLTGDETDRLGSKSDGCLFASSPIANDIVFSTQCVGRRAPPAQPSPGRARFGARQLTRVLTAGDL